MTLKFNPLNLLVPLWLCHTAHCEGKIVSAHGFCVNRKGGIGRGGWVTYKVLCMSAACYIGLAVKGLWLGLVGQL